MARRAKGKPARRTRVTRTAKSPTPTRRSVKRPNRNASPKRKSAAASKKSRKTTAKRAGGTKKAQLKRAPARKPAARKPAARPTARPAGAARPRNAGTATKAPRLDRARRMLEETVQTPPSSLDMNRRGSAARTGRAEIAESLDEHRGMAQAITAGDADVDVENAYFTGDEAPGGDNPAPDEEVVDDIGKALGVQYEDNEELKASDKIVERDRHRWEMDPASSEDYKERK
jgi:hypothetical protein